jgi:hypothetical protein
MRRFLICVSMLALANCGGGDIPNSGYVPQQEQRIRDAALAGIPPPVEVETGELDVQTGDFTQQETQTSDAPLAAGDPLFDNPGLSDEQDFDAVSDRQSIESDAARLERNRALYKVISPTALPRRPGSNAPNIVEYAIRTNNPVGTQLYSRGPFATEGRFKRNCQKYASDAAAQEAFLAKGGPERDRYGLDPDGDGYACYWDPAPFRLARKK